MPEIIPIGWFHTIMGIIALISGAVALAKYKEIGFRTRYGQVYLATTFLTATTALAIYQHGTFGVAHVLAVMTLLALAVGAAAETTKFFGKFSRYVQAISYSSTLFFHTIPAITDGLLRLPPGDPILSSIESPVLRMCYLALLVTFLIGVTLQLRWIYKQRQTAAA